MKKQYDLTIETTGRGGPGFSTEKLEAAILAAVEAAIPTLTFPLGGAEVKVTHFAPKPPAPAPAPAPPPAPAPAPQTQPPAPASVPKPTETPK